MLCATFLPGSGTRPFVSSRHASTCHFNRTARGDVSKLRVAQQAAHSHPDSSQPSIATSDGNGAVDSQGKASSDVLRLFSETQRNLLELNRSRLSALDELRAAKNKISALEDKLEEASVYAPSEKHETHLPSESTDNQQQAQPSTHQDVPQGIITVAYHTGWSRVMIHYKADGQAWTDLPGVQMESGSEDLSGCKVLQISSSKIEFVLNDGSGQWDTPDPYGAGQNKNYRIDTPGTYRLKDGKLSKLQ